MTDEAYNRAKTIFLAACDLEPESRGEVLERECGGDADLRREVESLLAHYDATMEIDGTSGPFTAASPAGEAAAAVPDRIGPYRILHELGRGGMGIVYLASREDKHFKQRVAIKIVRKGMDTESVLRRFDLERQVLAALNHPNIARLYDGGETDDGRPYFAMEYVEGVPIDRYCDTHRLPVPARLGLFRGVCSAVHYAHKNLVVHRDIKPGNILVTKDGLPKLMDFGIVKLVNPELSFMTGAATAPEFRVMTPEYASPEQVRGEPITTASDIYSLGVLLYQLVSGHRPYRIRSRVRAEIERIVCDEEPERPSTAVSWVEELDPGAADPETGRTVTPESVSRTRETRPERLRKVLTGDIDNIVLMAMRKEPDRRYRSADEFGEDIRRHLDGMPVVARADTLGYRAAKFVRRHRGGVTAAAGFVLLLAAATIVSLALWRVAVEQRQVSVEQRQVAERRFDQVRSIARRMMYGIHDEIDTLEGSLPARRMLAETAREYLDALAADAADDPALAREVADAYDRLGRIEGGIRGPSLGARAGALDRYRVARELRAPLLAATPGDPELRRATALNHIHFGDVYRHTGETAAAGEEYEKALAICRTLPDDDPGFRRLYGAALVSLGKIVARQDNAAAMTLYLEALPIRETLHREDPGNTDYRRDLSSIHLYIGGRLFTDGDLDGALTHYRQSRDHRVTLHEREPDDRTRRDLAVAEYFLGTTLLEQGHAQEALDHLDTYVELVQRRAEHNPLSARARRDLSLVHEARGRAAAALDQWELAHEHYMAYRFETGRLVDDFRDETHYRALYASSHERLGEATQALGRERESAGWYGQALALVEALAAEDPGDDRWQQDLARLTNRDRHRKSESP